MDLFLKYTNESGEPRRIPVKAEKFTIGRHSENDLAISKNQLSRHHADIERYEDAFILADNNSSNGTTLNGRSLERPTALKNGDRFNLGGGADFEVELRESAAREAETSVVASPVNLPLSGDKAAANAEAESIAQAEIASEVKASDFAPAIANPPKSEKSGMGIFFIIAPIMVLFVLLIGGLILFLIVPSKTNDVAGNKGGFIYSSDKDNDDDDPPKNKKSETPSPSPKDSGSNSNSSSGNSLNTSNSTPTSSPSVGNTPVPISNETSTIEGDALNFLRRIAKTDPNPVLTDEQIGIIGATIKSVKYSALKDNLQAVNKSRTQIESLAKLKNLRPQFLAAAALAKIGSTRGDPFTVAQGMADELNQLSNLIANDFSDDSLMIIAAYQEGGAKSNMPSMLANLTKSSPADARRIRTIWFLHKNGKISEAQYQFALRFLALGTIMQNPKDFSVDTEAVVFN